MKLSELGKKDVININNGSKVGVVVDIIISDDGMIKSIIVDKSNVFNLFQSKDDIEILYKDIKKIGDDVIIIDYPVNN